MIKVYPSESATERLNAELSFLKFVGKIAPDKVPKVIGSDSNKGMLATTYISGRTRSLLKTDDLSQFINFQKELDLYKNISEASGLYLARDNVLSTQSIDQQIDRRLSSFYSMAMPNSYSYFLNIEFPKTKFELVSKIFEKLHNGNTLADEVLQKKYQTPIASDFGLHNIICKPSGDFVFVDFEFAGWDDPCTLIANFVLHPGMSGQAKNRRVFEQEMLRHYSYIPNLKLDIECDCRCLHYVGPLLFCAASTDVSKY